MRGYLEYTRITVLLTLRDRVALFFSYIFPLMFFFIFAESTDAEQGGVITQVVTMVLILAILGNGLFGAGVRAVRDREMDILRRFKVTPMSPAPILAASMVTGWLVFLPVLVLTIGLAHFLYGMETPVRLLSLFWLVSLGVIAFRAIGLIIASVVNSAQESAILTQLLYLPMLFLSGAVFPITMLPNWAQVIVQFLPASYLSTGFQGIMIREESLAANWDTTAALVLTTVFACFLSMKLFRWEKEEKLPASAKLWVLAVLLPFLVLGSYEVYSRHNVNKARALYRELRRSRTLLVRDARVFVGDGTVIESGAVLVRNGKVEEVFEGSAPDPKALKADVIEASGKTLLPGLIDAHVHLAAPGGIYDPPSSFKPGKAVPRALAAYLYSGVTTVRSAGDPLDEMLRVRALVQSSERLGAELFLCGPMFTTEGGHGTEYLQSMPEFLRFAAEKQLVRLPATPEEARRQVDGLSAAGVNVIDAALDAGRSGMLLNRMDSSLLDAIAEEARVRDLPLLVHTGDSRDVVDALRAGAVGIEHGSFRDLIPSDVFAEMVRRGVAYDPTLSVAEALSLFAAGSTKSLERSLVLQVGPVELVEGTRRVLQSAEFDGVRQRLGEFPLNIENGMENLRRAQRAGVMLVAGSGAGSPLVFHGPAIHRELQLWVQAGIPPQVALEAATYNAARLLRAESRIGLIRKGRDADLLIVDGNPLEDISATERISVVIFKGERIIRTELFGQE